MVWLRPDDGPTVAAGDEEQPFADGRRAVGVAPQLAPLHLVTVAAQGVDEAVEGPALVLRAGAAIGKRTPSDELLDVLQHDHARLHGGGVADRHPGKPPDLLLDRLATLGLAEVFAVGAEPGQLDGLAAGDGARVDLPHRFAIVLGVGMVDLVHGDGFGVVVDGDIHRAA
ncbi:hypothetical protein D9M70_519990 [compost metagenome]